MILVDYMGHMVSTESAEELHNFARILGLKRSWYQSHADHPHYDLTTARMRMKAVRMGATETDPVDLLKRAWWYEERNRRILEALRLKQESKESSHEHES
ncbi:MAG: DUF4031 domain-containing protein [bacterium]